MEINLLSCLRQEVIERVAASLKDGGIAAGKQYFCRARREHVLQTQGRFVMRSIA